MSQQTIDSSMLEEIRPPSTILFKRHRSFVRGEYLTVWVGTFTGRIRIYYPEMVDFSDKEHTYKVSTDIRIYNGQN